MDQKVLQEKPRYIGKARITHMPSTTPCCKTISNKQTQKRDPKDYLGNTIPNELHTHFIPYPTTEPKIRYPISPDQKRRYVGGACASVVVPLLVSWLLVSRPR
jgi:hypothetical protein